MLAFRIMYPTFDKDLATLLGDVATLHRHIKILLIFQLIVFANPLLPLLLAYCSITEARSFWINLNIGMKNFTWIRLRNQPTASRHCIHDRLSQFIITDVGSAVKLTPFLIDMLS